MFKKSGMTVTKLAEGDTAAASREAVRRGSRKAFTFLGRSLAVLSILGGTAAMSTSSASAAGSDFLRNWENGRCLDSNAAGEVYTNPCQFGNNYQQWQILNLHHGEFGYDVAQFKNVATGLYLRYVDYPQTGPYTDAQRTYWAGAGSDWQHAALLPQAGGANICLSGDGGGIVWTEPCSGAGYQNWKYGF
ncbi:RICIN domain-containing protein [Streptomyces sp. NPDC001675]